MRNRSITSIMAALLTVVLVSQASAQQHQVPRSPRHYSPSGDTTYHNQPFLPIPFAMDPFHWEEETDAQFFAPAELGDLGNPPPLRSGIFASYERMNLHISRPNRGPQLIGLDAIPTPGPAVRYNNVSEHQSWGVDGGWGNRFTFGWGDEKGHAWLGRYEKLRVATDNRGGPFGNFLAFPRTDFDFNDSLDPENPQPDFDSDGIPDTYTFLPNSINNAHYQNIELNHVIRLKRLYRGGVLEPYLGIRYSQFDSRHQETGFVMANEGGAVIGFTPNTVIPVQGIIQSPLLGDIIGPTAVSDNWFFLQSGVENKMFGGQLGMRWRNQIGRWKIGLDSRAFAMHNWQMAQGTFQQVSWVTTSVSGDLDDTTQRNITTVSDFHREFTFGGDLRAELGIQATRDFSFIIAFQGLAFARGISRDAIIPFPTERYINSHEAVYMGGVTFGVEYNK